MKRVIQKTMTGGERKFSIFNFPFSILLLLAAMVATSCGGSSGSNPETNASANEEVKTTQAATDKKLPFERGSYVEESNVMGMDLKKTVYFDKWGDWTASEDKSEMSIMGQTIKTHKLEIVKGKTHWDIDLIEKTGRQYELNFAMQGMAEMMAAAIGGKMAEGIEMKELGEEDYLGYTCKKVWIKYDDMQMEATTLAYGNLTMKMEGKVGGMNISNKITSIDLSAPPASVFEVPDGVIIEVENY